MIIEQAFLMLPEILHGSGYQKQDYEAGIVGAFSLSLLQTLNGRNAPNPISFIQHERLFRIGGVYAPGQDPRYLRADLYLNIGHLKVGSKRLSQYGWRHEVWIESKFYRNQAGADGNRHSTNKSSHVGNLLADIIRLCVLVPEPDDESRTGRYFLHCYDADPDRYLAYSRRAYLKKLVEPGFQELTLSGLPAEKDTIKRIIGDLGDLQIDLKVTNYVLKPLLTDERPVYNCILTRIDSFAIRHPIGQCGLGLDRVVNNRAILDQVSAHVANRIHVKPNDQVAPEPGEEQGPAEDQG